MIYIKLRIVIAILIVAIVLSCICVSLVRKFVFPPPAHEEEAAIYPLGQCTRLVCSNECVPIESNGLFSDQRIQASALLSQPTTLRSGLQIS